MPEPSLALAIAVGFRAPGRAAAAFRGSYYSSGPKGAVSCTFGAANFTDWQFYLRPLEPSLVQQAL
jgi:hypothetical protein